MNLGSISQQVGELNGVGAMWISSYWQLGYTYTLGCICFDYVLLCAMIKRIGFNRPNQSYFDWILDLWIQDRRKGRLGRNSVLKSINTPLSGVLTSKPGHWPFDWLEMVERGMGLDVGGVVRNFAGQPVGVGRSIEDTVSGGIYAEAAWDASVGDRIE